MLTSMSPTFAHGPHTSSDRSCSKFWIFEQSIPSNDLNLDGVRTRIYSIAIRRQDQRDVDVLESRVLRGGVEVVTDADPKHYHSVTGSWKRGYYIFDMAFGRYDAEDWEHVVESNGKHPDDFCR